MLGPVSRTHEAIFRIAQEALANIGRRARATHVPVPLGLAAGTDPTCEPLPASTVQSTWHCQTLTENSATLHLEALVDARVTDGFSVLRTTVTGSSPWRAGRLHGFAGCTP